MDLQFTDLTMEHYALKTQKSFKKFKRDFTWVYQPPDIDIWPIIFVKTFGKNVSS